MSNSDLGVVVGGGSFFGSLAGICAPLISTTPEFLHWFPLGFAVIGVGFGFWLARRMKTQ